MPRTRQDRRNAVVRQDVQFGFRKLIDELEARVPGVIGLGGPRLFERNIDGPELVNRGFQLVTVSELINYRGEINGTVLNNS